MFNKFLFILFCTICFSNVTFSQNSITGKVIDGSNTPIYGVNVLLMDETGVTMIKGGITDEDGMFSLEKFKDGQYKLTISMLGFDNYEKQIEIQNESIDLGTITLIEGTALEEVVIKTSKPLFEQKVDRVVVNVSENATSAGGNVLEVLEKSPGIIVDKERGVMSMNGKEGLLVMINGKVSRQPLNSVIQMLGGMSSDNIKEIELINNPSSKYDAASNAGVINIVLAKGEDLGLNGSYSLTAGYGEYEKYGGTVNMNYRKGKTNIYSDISYSHNKTFTEISNYRETSFDNEINISDSDTDRQAENDNVMAKLGADFQLSERSIFGVFLSGYIDRWDVNATTIGSEGNGINTGEDYLGIGEDSFEQNHLTSNVNFFHTFKDKSTINFDVDYIFHKNINPSDILYTFEDQFSAETSNDKIEITKETPINIVVGGIDYSKKVKNITIETGVKGINSDFENEVIFARGDRSNPIVDSELSDDSDLNEKIGAAYGSVGYKSEKNQLTVGLRYEYSETKLNTPEGRDDINLTYSELFPSLMYTRSFTENTKLTLSYGRKIQRPAYTDLTPYFVFINPTTFYFGNTNLVAAINNDISAKLLYKKYSLLLSYNRGDNTIVNAQPSINENTEDQIIAPINLDYSETYSLNLSIPLKINNWMSFNFNFLGINQKNKPKNEGIGEQTYFRVNGSQSMKLPKDFSVDISGYYQSKGILGITTIRPYGDLAFGVQKKFSENSKLRFSFNNIVGFTFVRNTDDSLNGLGFSSEFRFFNEPRVFRLNYSYNFGNKKLKSKRQRNNISDDVKQRI